MMGHPLRVLRGAVGEYLGLTLVLLVLILFFGLSTRRFFSASTFVAIANQIPAPVIIAVGMTYVLIIAGIDLSVGSVFGLSGAFFGLCLVHLKIPVGIALVVGMLACLAAGLVCGALNGLFTVRWGIPSFIVTLGMLEAARGATHLVTSSQTQYVEGKAGPIAGTTLLTALEAVSLGLARGAEALLGKSILELSLAVPLALLVVAAAQFVLSRTVDGRYLVAIGTNEEAVRLSGIDPRPVKLKVFVLSGFLAGVAAVLDTSRIGSAIPTAGTGYELDAIAAVVIGGTSLMGGRGSVVSSLFGVVIIAVLGFGLAMLNVRDEHKRLITGCVIVAAVLADQYRDRLRKAGSRR